jgi:hypothetical protein
MGRLAPDHKTIADFRKDNGTTIRKVRARFVALTIGPAIGMPGRMTSNSSQNTTSHANIGLSPIPMMHAHTLGARFEAPEARGCLSRRRRSRGGGQ